jgi:hypothetical protein
VKNIKITRAIVALAPIAVLSSALSLTNAQAQTAGKALVMSVYLDAVGGESLLAGNYAGALEEIAHRGPFDNLSSLAVATNLCVAYTMTRQWDEAKSRCDAAIAGARVRDPDDVFDFGAGHEKRLATAYSNRAVFNWMHDQKRAAITDLSKARSHAPRLEFVAQNWLALNEGSDTTAAPQIASTRP